MPNLKIWWSQGGIRRGSRMYHLNQKIKFAKKQIKHWNRNVFGIISKASHKLETKMEKLQEKIVQEGRKKQHIKEEQCIQQDLSRRDKQEETLWRQKSRIKWLKEGDKNNKFFHNSMINRRTHNHIMSLRTETREVLESHKDFEDELQTHFSQILMQ